jgi:hypothetical protein
MRRHTNVLSGDVHHRSSHPVSPSQSSAVLPWAARQASARSWTRGSAVEPKAGTGQSDDLTKPLIYAVRPHWPSSARLITQRSQVRILPGGSDAFGDLQPLPSANAGSLYEVRDTASLSGVSAGEVATST